MPGELYNLYQRIIELRTSINITQAQLAKRLGVTRSAVNSWEMGMVTPQLKHIVEMAKIFNVTIDSMLYDSEKTVVDITGLSKPEKDIVLSLVNVFCRNRAENEANK